MRLSITQVRQVLASIQRRNLTALDVSIFTEWIMDNEDYNFSPIIIAKRYNVMPSRISRSMSRLVKAGILEVTEVNGRRRSFSINKNLINDRSPQEKVTTIHTAPTSDTVALPDRIINAWLIKYQHLGYISTSELANSLVVSQRTIGRVLSDLIKEGVFTVTRVDEVGRRYLQFNKEYENISSINKGA